jgi:hypothetical protein
MAIVSKEILKCLLTLKTYGKQAEQADAVTEIFLEALADYPVETVMNALGKWRKTEQEFPTIADILGLIKRGGRPPLRESDVIAVRKKHGEDRTPYDWQLLREWEAQQQEGWGDAAEPRREQALQAENARLRQEMQHLQRENAALRLSEKRQETLEAHIPKPITPPFAGQSRRDAEEIRFQRTIATLKAQGASDAYIAEFVAYEMNKPQPLQREA